MYINICITINYYLSKENVYFHMLLKLAETFQHRINLTMYVLSRIAQREKDYIIKYKIL